MELKQLRYLVVCAQRQSISRAAEVLYTTQPNVSKAIRSLEDELGFELFIRQGQGIQLTDRGNRVYEYACRVMENVENISSFASMDKGEELLVSSNPSSWMTACFAEFYNQHQNENVCFHFITTSVEDIIHRCGSGRDQLGFVYIMEPQMPLLKYKLKRNQLEFVELKRVKAMLYFGKNNTQLLKSESVENMQMENVRLVQCYGDEFALNCHWNLENDEKGKLLEQKAAVITNSDHLMRELLQHTDLGNIGGDDLNGGKASEDYKGISLYGDETPVIFGYMRKKQEAGGSWAEKFVAFAEQRMRRCPGTAAGVKRYSAPS